MDFRGPSSRGGRLRRTAVVVAVNIVSIVFVWYLAELYARSKGLLGFRRTYPGQYRNGASAPWAKSDSTFGWTIQGTFMGREHEINPQGFRDAKDFDRIDPRSTQRRILILGDSFMAGAGKKEENVSSLLEAKLGTGHEVFNLGVYGWGIDQMYLAFLHFKDRINPGVVILAFIDDDVTRVIHAYRTREQLTKPALLVSHGALVPRPPASESERALDKLTGWSVFLSYARREILLQTEVKATVTHMLREMAQATTRSGGKLVVVRIPTRDHEEFLARARRRLYDFEDALKGSGMQYLDPVREIADLRKWLASFTHADGHLNAAGDRFLSDYIHRHVFQN